MVPPNQTLIQEKTDTVLRCLQRIVDKRPPSLSALQRDIDSQDILIVNLERSIQACVDIASHLIAYTPLPAPPTMAESFVILEQARIISGNVAKKMQKAVALRNILVHEYKKIDWSILWAVVTLHLDDFHDFLKEISNQK